MKVIFSQDEVKTIIEEYISKWLLIPEVEITDIKFNRNLDRITVDLVENKKIIKNESKE